MGTDRFTCRRKNLLAIGNAGTAEFLNDERHAEEMLNDEC
jgi:hypothetical protein